MAKNTIYLAPIDQSAHQVAPIVEGLAVDAFLPGTLVKQVAGGLETSDKLATVFNSEVLIALEYGDHTGQDIDTAYTIGGTALAVRLPSGQRAQARLAASQNITVKGTALSSNGDGTLKIAATDGTEQVLAYSNDVTAGASSAGDLIEIVKA